MTGKLKWIDGQEPVSESTRFDCRACGIHIDAPEGMPQSLVDDELRAHIATHPDPKREPYGDKGTPISAQERARLAHDLEQYHWDGAQWQTEECAMFCRIIELLRTEDDK